MQKKLMVEKLTDEEEAQLGLVVRAVHDLCLTLGVPQSSLSFLMALTEGLVRSALSRAKPNRRGAYLDQWRQFVCWLPECLSRHPTDDRIAIAGKAIRQFHLKDRRGKRKPGAPFPQEASCLLEKDGELWYAKAAPQSVQATKVVFKPPPKRQWKRFAAGGEVHKKSKPQSSIDVTSAEFLEPIYPPGALKREHTKLLRALPPQDPFDNEGRIVALVPDIPANLLRNWIREGVSRGDLALLIAARRAKMTAKVSNLPHLHEALRWAR